MKPTPSRSSSLQSPTSPSSTRSPESSTSLSTLASLATYSTLPSSRNSTTLGTPILEKEEVGWLDSGQDENFVATDNEVDEPGTESDPATGHVGTLDFNWEFDEDELLEFLYPLRLTLDGSDLRRAEAARRRAMRPIEAFFRESERECEIVVAPLPLMEEKKRWKDRSRTLKAISEFGATVRLYLRRLPAEHECSLFCRMQCLKKREAYELEIARRAAVKVAKKKEKQAKREGKRLAKNQKKLEKREKRRGEVKS